MWPASFFLMGLFKNLVYETPFPNVCELKIRLKILNTLETKEYLTEFKNPNYDEFQHVLSLMDTSSKIFSLIYEINYILLFFVHYLFILQHNSFLNINNFIEYLRIPTK